MFHVKLLTFFQHACQTYLSLSVTGTTKQRSNDSFGLKCSDFFFCCRKTFKSNNLFEC